MNDARRRHRRLDQRPQLPDQRRAVEFGGGIRHPEAVGRAAAGAECLQDRRTRCGRSCSRFPARIVLSFDPPSIPGLGATGGFEFQVEDLTGRGSVALNEATQAVIAEARKQPEISSQQLFTSFSTSTPQFNYDLDRNKAKLLGPQPAGRVQHAADLSGLALCQRLQPVRPHLPRDAAGRQGRARLGHRHLAPLCAQRYRRHGAAEHARHAEADRRSRDRAALQQLCLRPDQWRRGARLQLRPGGGGDGARRRSRPAARLRLSNGPASPSRSSRPDRSPRWCSGSRSSSCSSSSPRNTRAGPCPSWCCSRCRWRCSARCWRYGCAACRSTSIRRSAS